MYIICGYRVANAWPCSGLYNFSNFYKKVSVSLDTPSTVRRIEGMLLCTGMSSNGPLNYLWSRREVKHLLKGIQV